MGKNDVICVVCGREAPLLDKLWVMLEVANKRPVGICEECAGKEHVLAHHALRMSVTVADMEREIGIIEEKLGGMENALFKMMEAVRKELGHGA